MIFLDDDASADQSLIGNYWERTLIISVIIKLMILILTKTTWKYQHTLIMLIMEKVTESTELDTQGEVLVRLHKLDGTPNKHTLRPDKSK